MRSENQTLMFSNTLALHRQHEFLGADNSDHGIRQITVYGYNDSPHLK